MLKWIELLVVVLLMFTWYEIGYQKGLREMEEASMQALKEALEEIDSELDEMEPEEEEEE